MREGDVVKIHLAVSGKGAFGGTITTTLCGRMNKKSDDGMNSTGDRAVVDCAHCLRILEWPEHWRYRKYVVQQYNKETVK